ncbi:MAG: protein translocase subunit SecD [Phycisphaeraceae bacterium]|nr:protein translocase subunit SecD [Phycisphaeraceae bacterium]
MDNKPLWKPLLIVAVILFSALMIWFPGYYGPKERLKPGIDLAGGTTLIYQVNVPVEMRGRSKEIVEDVISVLRSRVDPDGVRNLIWRPQAGNRIEIQMPVASPEVRQRRQDYLQARQALLAGNLSPLRLQSALRTQGDQRRELLDSLAEGSGAKRELLNRLAEANDALTGVSQAYQQAEQKKREAEKALAALPVEQEKARLAQQKVVDDALAEAITLGEAYNAAQRQYADREKEVLADNVDPQELEQVLLLYEPGKGKTIARQKYEETKQRFLDLHPGRHDHLLAAAEAYERFVEVKGPLDDPTDLIALLKGSGILEFRVGLPASMIPDVETYRRNLRERGPRYGQNLDFRWFVIDDLEQFVDDSELLAKLKAKPEQWENFVAQQRAMVGQAYGEKVYLLLGNTPAISLTQASGDWRVVSAMRTMDGETMLPAAAFSLDARGGALMGAMSSQHIGKPMAIMLDGRVMSAPRINSRLFTNVQVTSPRGFNPRELNYLVRTLKAGSIQGSLSPEPISVNTTGPQLGQDNLRHGLEAAVYAFIAVAGFMTVYYFVAGLTANFTLVLNILIILAAMAMFQGTFTLAGIAGVVLTIGMAVDANVLIFERIREEQERGNEIHTALRLGFDRAFTTILDSNLTTVITCVVLYYTATADVKGFALTLIIGLLANLFAAVFCGRVVLDLWVDLTKGKKLLMLPMVVPAIARVFRPNINWMSKQYIFWSVSLSLAALGGWALWQRGADMLDIEFSSGTRVTFELKEGATLPLDETRQRVEKALPDRVNGVVSVGTAEAGGYRSFAVQTLETDSRKVSDKIKEAFADVLDTQRPIHFAGMGDVDKAAPDLQSAAVFPVNSRALGQNINRPDVNFDSGEYVGGVAIVLSDMTPAPTVADLRQRIERIRQSPEYEQIGYRSFTIVPLDLAPGQTQNYSSAVVLVRDDQTNYVQEPDRFIENGGLAATEWALTRDALLRDTSLASVTKFDSQVSSTMRNKAIQALILGNICVGLYIWLRFGTVRYGIAAIVALIHDVVIAMGMVGFSAYLANTSIGQALGIVPFRIDLSMVAAVLTLVGYSLNDTIVVFDRIRENRGRLAFATPQIINDSINQTISRTVLTQFTGLVAIVMLFIFGGMGIRGFAYAMTVGVVVGTYSSIAIAAPLLLIFGERESDKPAKPQPAAATA